jgi:hypothetical protein
MDRDEAQQYVRAVWPAAQSRFEELVDSGSSPDGAAQAALSEIDGLSWSHQEALESAGLAAEWRVVFSCHSPEGHPEENAGPFESRQEAEDWVHGLRPQWCRVCNNALQERIEK